MFSIIIPAFNEESSIAKLVQYVLEYGRDEVEVIVVDGGSTDQTMEVATEAGAIVIQSPEKGRAKQMNFGAQRSKYPYLYFLHADTYPPKNFIEELKKSIDLGFESGCFRLLFDYDHPILKFYCWFTKFDIDFFRFGDQSLYIQKELFEEVGKFDEKLIVMEDQEIIRAIKMKSKFNIINNSVVTSARKYQKIGVIKLQLIFTTVLTMYYIGIDQQKIVDFYFRSIR